MRTSTTRTMVMMTPDVSVPLTVFSGLFMFYLLPLFFGLGAPGGQLQSDGRFLAATMKKSMGMDSIVFVREASSAVRAHLG